MKKEKSDYPPDNKSQGVYQNINDKTLKILLEIAKDRTVQSAYFWGTLIGIIVGALFCLSGLIITILGLSGSIEWVFEAVDVKSRLTNAGPGVFFALLGMLILWRYRPKVVDSLALLGLLKRDQVMRETSISD